MRRLLSLLTLLNRRAAFKNRLNTSVFGVCAAFRCRLETWGLQCSREAVVESNPNQVERTTPLSYWGVLIFNVFSG